MVSVKVEGNYTKTEKFLRKIENLLLLGKLDEYGKMGVEALSANTPRDTGKTAESWGYEFHFSKDSFTINWTNSNISEYIPVALLIQYGHGTKSGHYVQGRDYINPAMQPVFDKIEASLWKEVTGR